MEEILHKLIGAPLSTILVLAGIVFVFIGFGGKFSERILTDNIPKSYSVAFGIVLIVVGVCMYFLGSQGKENIPGRTSVQDTIVHNQLKSVTFSGSRENSGSIFEDLDTGKRTVFGSQDTKHNDTCWVGRRSGNEMSTAFLDVHMYLPGVLLDRVQVKDASFVIEAFTKVEDEEITRWLGPLMVLSLDYGELDVTDLDSVIEKGQTIRSFENIYDLYKTTDITAVVGKLFRNRQEHLRLVFVFPGRGQGHESSGKIHFEPEKVHVTIEYEQVE